MMITKAPFETIDLKLKAFVRIPKSTSPNKLTNLVQSKYPFHQLTFYLLKIQSPQR